MLITRGVIHDEECIYAYNIYAYNIYAYNRANRDTIHILSSLFPCI